MAGRVPASARGESHVSYYVMMAVVVALLVALCCYACYYFVTKIRELSESELPPAKPSTSCANKDPVSYPVQSVVRDGATAMAALCRQLPAGRLPPGDRQVFPAGRSPDARPALATPSPRSQPLPLTPSAPGSPPLSPSTTPPGIPHSDRVDKAPTAVNVPCITLEIPR